MKISEQIRPYEQEIRKNVLRYAYENYNIPPLLEQQTIPDWVGEIFLVSDIAKHIHWDVVDDLEELGLLSKIQKECDKFVILPDVWRISPFPLTLERNQYDHDRQNVVFINGKILEMYLDSMVHYSYSHNQKVYFFYKANPAGDIFVPEVGQTPKLSVLNVHDLSFIQDKMEYPWWDSLRSRYLFDITPENKIAPNGYNGPKMSICVESPYVVFDYAASGEPTVAPTEISGLYSITPDDAYIQERQFSVRDQVYVHNRNVLFSNTFLVIFQDGSYHIENTYDLREGKYVTKIDKHTIQFHKTDQIKKIVVFLRPYEVPTHRIDSVYDEAMRENKNAYLRLQKHNKYTNVIYHKLCEKDLSLEELVDFGYKYDMDILYCILRTFPAIQEFSPESTGKVVTCQEHERQYYLPKYEIVVNNKLEQNVMVFLNRRLFCFPFTKWQGFDCEYMRLNPEHVIALLDPSTSVTEYQLQDTKWLAQWWKDHITSVIVVFGNYHETKANLHGVRYAAKTYRNAIGPECFFVTANGEDHAMTGYPFVNGCFTAEDTTDRSIKRRLEPMSFFGQGDLNYSRNGICSTTGAYFTDPSKLYVGYHRMKEKFLAFQRVWFGGIHERVTVSEKDRTVPKATTVLYHDRTLVLDKYGLCCNPEITILGDHRLNADYMYDYLPEEELENEIQLHLFPIPPVDPVRGYDLRIDPAKIQGGNVGSWNETVLQDPMIESLFNANKPERLITPNIEVKDGTQQLHEKSILRYWLSGLGVGTDKLEWTRELSSLGIAWIGRSGIANDAPSWVKPWIQWWDQYSILEQHFSGLQLEHYWNKQRHHHYITTQGSIEPKLVVLDLSQQELPYYKHTALPIGSSIDILGGKA